MKKRKNKKNKMKEKSTKNFGLKKIANRTLISDSPDCPSSLNVSNFCAFLSQKRRFFERQNFSCG